MGSEGREGGTRDSPTMDHFTWLGHLCHSQPLA